MKHKELIVISVVVTCLGILAFYVAFVCEKELLKVELDSGDRITIMYRPCRSPLIMLLSGVGDVRYSVRSENSLYVGDLSGSYDLITDVELEYHILGPRSLILRETETGSDTSRYWLFQGGEGGYYRISEVNETEWKAVQE